MSKVLVLYYSSYGHIETMAEAVAEGARSTGATVDIKRIPETVPQDVAEAAHFKLDQKAPVAATTTPLLSVRRPDSGASRRRRRHSWIRPAACG
jgi:multimeric flavodoxin WrbA